MYCVIEGTKNSNMLISNQITFSNFQPCGCCWCHKSSSKFLDINLSAVLKKVHIQFKIFTWLRWQLGVFRFIFICKVIPRRWANFSYVATVCIICIHIFGVSLYAYLYYDIHKWMCVIYKCFLYIYYAGQKAWHLTRRQLVVTLFGRLCMLICMSKNDGKIYRQLHY